MAGGLKMITRKEFYENQKRCELNIAAVAQTFPVDTEKLRKYFISYDEANRITKLVIENELPYDTYDKIETPKISINVSPQASGKTVLNDYAIKKMGKENCFLINSDELKKKYYPNSQELSKSEFSAFYSCVSDIGSNLFTRVLLNEALKRRCNIIFEGTGKSNAILDSIEPHRGIYVCKVRSLAVSAMTSLASIVERYINQAQSKGDCARLVRYSDFLASFQNITHLLNVSEQRGIYTEVFTRSVTPSETTPIKIYATDQKGRFESAHNAVLYARETDAFLRKEENLAKVRSMVDYLNKTESSLAIHKEMLNILYRIMLLTDNSSSSVYSKF